MLGAEFLAVVQVIVYTGAILVLLLFVLMLVDPDDLPKFYQAAPLQRYLSLLLGAILLLEVAAAIITRTSIGAVGTASPDAIEAVGGNAQAMGHAIYSHFLLAFEVTSLVLTVGVIGAVVLALPERLGERKNIALKKSVPVAWVYLTGWQGADGQVQFRDDIYGLDTPQGIVTSTIQPRKPKPKATAAVPPARPAAAPKTASGNAPAAPTTASN